MADGPLTVLPNALGTVDTSNSLVLFRGTTSGGATPAKPGFMLMIRTDNARLIVALAAAYST